ncbi:MAG: hypothetical protein WC967_13085 [Balneolaceae bacterium]
MYNTATGQEQLYYVGAQNIYGHNPKDMIHRFGRTSPIEISPHNNNMVFYGSQYVMRTTNGGLTWTKASPDLTAFKPQYQVTSGTINRDLVGSENFSTLNEIRVSLHDKDVIWTTSNDGIVQITRDDGKTWTDITPPNLPENALIDGLEPSSHKPGKAYIAAWRRFLDDFKPYIYRTDDYGQNWTLLTDGKNGMSANNPTRAIREDTEREGLLFAGTDWGLFVSFDDGGNWQPLEQGLPTTAVTDIRVHANDLILSTYGRDFYILDNLTLLRQIDNSFNSNENHLFQTNDAYRMRYRTSNRKDIVPNYPAVGATIDFYIPKEINEPISLEITDQNGNLVRSYRGTFKKVKKEGEEDKKDKEVVDSLPGTASNFTVKEGHNRFNWDLRYLGKTIKSSDGEMYHGPSAGYNATPGQSGGPLVVPDRYNIRLTVGKWSSSQPLTVKMDPRVKASGVNENDLEAQLELNLKIRDLIGNTQKLAADIDTLRTKLKPGKKTKSLDKLYNQLVTEKGISYPQVMLIDQVQYLYRMTTSADQRPGNEAYTRYMQLNAEFNQINNIWKTLKE